MVCTNQSLIDIPVNGSYYTWCNGRSRINIVERKLDGIFCNQNLLIACNSISTFTLHKLRSDHHPILLDVKFSVLCFASQLKFLFMLSLHDQCNNLIRLATVIL